MGIKNSNAYLSYACSHFFFSLCFSILLTIMWENTSFLSFVCIQYNIYIFYICVLCFYLAHINFENHSLNEPHNLFSLNKQKYWVGQKLTHVFSVRCYGKRRTNSQPNIITHWIHELIFDICKIRFFIRWNYSELSYIQ